MRSFFRAQGVTVNVVLAAVFVIGSVAVIVVIPAVTAVAKPVACIVATAVFDELQFEDAVQSRVVPSEYVPVAPNCCVAPFAEMLAFTGVIAMEASGAEVTTSVVEPLTVVVPVIVDVNIEA